MNKKFLSWVFYDKTQRCKHFFRIMKITTLFLFVLIFCLHAENTNSQNVRVTVKQNNVELGNVLSLIENQTDYLFIYDKYVNVNRKVSVNLNKKPLEEVLGHLFEGTDVKYTVDGSYIILSLKGESKDFSELIQQRRKIGGVVTDVAGEPVIGANVSVKGLSIGTITDIDGNFTLEIPDNAVILVSYIGYVSQEIRPGSGNQLKIILREDTQALEEVVVVGYTSQKKELLTGAVATMKMNKELANTPTTGFGNILAGKLSGVSVGTPDGLPGQQPSISVRSKSSWNDQPVLYVIDGKISTQSDFNGLSANEIENVTVLKDAASTAVYGSRAAGGVILVTTKRGGYGQKVQINYSFSTGFDKRGKNVELTDGPQTARLYQRINPTSDPAGWAWTDEDIEFIKTINGGWGYDLLKSVWRDPNTTSHNIDVTGGTDKVKFFVGGSFTKQKGFLPNLDYKKYNMRMNISAKLSENLDIFAALYLNDNNSSSTTGASVGDIYGLYKWLLNWQPDYPVWTKGGLPIDIGWTANIAAQVRGDGGYVKTNYLKPVINANMTYKVPFIKGLSATAAFSKSYTQERSKTFLTRYKMYVTKKTGKHNFSIDDADIVGTTMSSQISKDYMQQDVKWSGDWQLNLQLNYNRTFKEDHNVRAALVFEKYETDGAGVSAGIESFPNYLTDQWWAASDDRSNSYVNRSTDFSDYMSGRQSWVGQLFYDYQGKYLASFSYRYDGSMNFSPDNRWGFFPSGSLGWIISKEPFFKVKGIDMLKLRGSVGLTGNDAVGGWQWLQSYVSGNSAYFGTSSSVNQGITYGVLPNESLTWEKSLNYNVGVDVNFLKNFNFSAEYYYVNTYDILGARSLAVPPTFSMELPSENYGEVHSKGVELTLGYENTFGDFNVFGSLVASYGNSNYVKYDDDKVTYNSEKRVGRSMTAVYGYVADRVIRTETELKQFKEEHPDYRFNGIEPQLGQIVYKDMDGPGGTPDGIVDKYDISILKKSNNPVVLGLTLGAEWKGLTIAATFNGNLKYYRWMKDLAGGTEWNRMWVNWYGDSWTPDNTNASLPKRLHAYDGSATYHDDSSFWLKRGDFLRLKNLNLSYTIPQKIYRSIGLDKVSVYFVGTNLFVLSGFNKNYYDPEMKEGFTFPIMKSYNFGVNVSF